MTKKIVVIFLVVLCLWNIADANTGESLEMRIYDRDLQVSDSEMHMMLEKAALEENGFKLEITTKVVSESGTGSDNPAYQKTHFYYKIVDCAQVPEVTEQLRSLIPGVLGSNIVTKVRREIKNKDLENLKKCQTGLEVHFKEAEGCYGDKNTRVVRRAKRSCWWCRGCLATKVLVDK